MNLINRITDPVELLFLKVIFSFHPSRVLPEDPDYPILIGACYEKQTFFVQGLTLAEGARPDEDDAISIKKCIISIMEAHSLKIKDHAESRYTHSSLKKIGVFLPKVMGLYPFSQAGIIQNVLEKLPHKSMPLES